MQVKIGKKLYAMDRQRVKGLLAVAGEQVPMGIYAVEKGSYVELLNIRCSSRGELKRRKRAYKEQGFKVYSNG